MKPSTHLQCSPSRRRCFWAYLHLRILSSWKSLLVWKPCKLRSETYKLFRKLLYLKKLSGLFDFSLIGSAGWAFLNIWGIVIGSFGLELLDRLNIPSILAFLPMSIGLIDKAHPFGIFRLTLIRIHLLRQIQLFVNTSVWGYRRTRFDRDIRFCPRNRWWRQIWSFARRRVLIHFSKSARPRWWCWGLVIGGRWDRYRRIALRQSKLRHIRRWCSRGGVRVVWYDWRWTIHSWRQGRSGSLRSTNAGLFLT